LENFSVSSDFAVFSSWRLTIAREVVAIRFRSEKTDCPETAQDLDVPWGEGK